MAISSLNTAQVSAIIFDFGGVLINIDYRLTEEAFRKLGVSDFKTVYSQAAQHGVFDDFETGQISADEWRNRVRQITGLSLVSDVDIDAAWNAMIIGMGKDKEELIFSLKARIPVYLLSNTNIVHEAYFTQQLINNFGWNPLSSMFDAVYFSHKRGMRKPHEATFNKVLDNHGLSAASTLFIDDSIQHIQGAKNAGLQTIFYQGENLEELFSPFLERKTR